MRFIYLAAVFWVIPWLQAQPLTISGSVFNAHDDTPLEGVSVTVEAENLLAVTDAEGSFVIQTGETGILSSGISAPSKDIQKGPGYDSRGRLIADITSDDMPPGIWYSRGSEITRAPLPLLKTRGPSRAYTLNFSREDFYSREQSVRGDTTGLQIGLSPHEPSFVQLALGNYWIYERFTVDSNGVETYEGIDSFYIADTVTIKGNLFYQYNGTWHGYTPGPTIQFLRDSGGTILNEDSEIIFSSDNFKDTLNINSEHSSIRTIYYTMTARDSLISVPAGDFKTYNFRGFAVMVPPNDRWWPVRLTHQFYARGVGMVKFVVFLPTSPDFIHRKLLRYQVN